ncbi:universal stress protein [Cellulomonas sp.]|uniref:universal stress protein n=1 Tax=Cellulomonas sp. TaxID=40001 RepID=UPI003BAAD3E9
MTRSAPHAWHGVPTPDGPAVVVGVIPGQSAAVVQEAARLARAMSAGLVCVWSDAARTFVARDPDGTLVTTPLDPDHVDDREDEVAAEVELAAEVERVLEGSDVPWRFVYTVGEASRELARLGQESGAAMIVIGSRRPGLGGWMNHLIGGSTAGHLAHTQPLPVTIVPQEHP